ncbi:MAG: MarR family transcriptional regulator [Proteobacteria bacterium]|nr:MarR family transcriptional regulator [Pseudomonadota bacterium]
MRTEPPEPRYFLCSLTNEVARKMVAYYNRALTPMGLTAQQLMAVGLLWREEGMSLGDFARRAGIGKAAAVTMIDRLEAQGLVRRAPHPSDGRLNVLELTDQARALGPKVAEMMVRLERAVEEALGEDNMRTLIRALTKIRDLDL